MITTILIRDVNGNTLTTLDIDGDWVAEQTRESDTGMILLTVSRRNEDDDDD